MTKKEGMPNVHITGRRYTAPREALKPHPLFNNQRNNQQTALPLPATGARQPRKAAHDRDNPVRLTKVKRLNRENDPGMQCAPPPRR